MSVPEPLQRVIDEFERAPRSLRLALLLEYANKLPPLPEAWAGATDRFERVEECQTPLFIASELQGDTVTVWFDAPPEAPTTRGFASILSHGLNDLPADEVLDTPGDIHARLGLTELVSPLRLRGMEGMLARLKTQIRNARST